jgi:DNA-binding Xre family transcriptional regulator
MANRVKGMGLSEIFAKNLTKVMQEHDLSSLELSKRAQLPQKSVWNAANNEHSCRLSNMEAICKALLVSPAVMLTPHLPSSILMSRRVPRLIDKYAKLSMDDRERLEAIIDGMLGLDKEKENNLE